jgi:hypothetical protein
MIAKAARDTQRPFGLRARFVRGLAFLRSPLAAIRARREAAEAAEDAWLNAEADAALAEGGPTIPLEEVKRRYGL